MRRYTAPISSRLLPSDVSGNAQHRYYTSICGVVFFCTETDNISISGEIRKFSSYFIYDIQAPPPFGLVDAPRIRPYTSKNREN